MHATLPLGVKHTWRHAMLVLAMVLICLVLLFWETAVAMVTIWHRSETFTHAFVVPPIVLWLVWRRRDEVGQIAPRPSFVALVPLGALAMLWLLGDLTAVNSVTQLAFVGMLVLAVPALLGMEVAYALLFPLCFLFFSVPIGEFLMPHFMEWTADFTVAALRLTGIPVLRDGLQFVIPSGNWSVVEACSGIRYLIASVTVGALYAHLNYQSTKRRIAFVLVSFVVPIIANWLRAYMIVMMGHLSGNTLAVGVDHLIYGWVFFGVVILLMFVIGARWAEPEPIMPSRTGMVFADAVSPPYGRFWGAAALVLVLVASPGVVRWRIDSNASTGAARMTAPVALGPGWRLVTPAAVEFTPKFENSTAVIHATYSDGQESVGLYLGYYHNQTYSRKLVSSSSVLVTSTDTTWSKVGSGVRATALGADQAMVRTVELRRVAVAGSGQSEQLTVWQIYWINGTLTSNDYVAKVYSAVYRLIGRGDDSAVIVVYAPRSVTGSTNASLESFMTLNFGAIDALLRQTKASR